MFVLSSSDWGRLVRDGVPKYNVTNALFITKVNRRIIAEGKVVLQFVHPITGRTIQVSYAGGDEYVDTKTKRVFIICVDNQGNTLLVYKSPHRSENRNLKKWGWVVKSRVPKYDISHAIYIMDTERKIRSNGMEMIEFIHPIMKHKIVIPAEGGDEYVKPNTRYVFIIFVDIQKRTLLIFKGLNYSDSQKLPSIVPKYSKLPTNSTQENFNDSLNKLGYPGFKVDISHALIIMKTKEIIGARGNIVVECVHPITRERIQVPLDSNDLYVDPASRQSFIVFIDAQGRTLLIFKGNKVHSGGSPKSQLSNDNNSEDVSKQMTEEVEEDADADADANNDADSDAEDDNVNINTNINTNINNSQLSS